VSIPDEKIESALNSIFGRSEPGAELHTMYLLAAGDDSLNAFGLPDPDKLQGSLYSIVPVVTPEEPNPEKFIAKTIMAAISEHRENGMTIYLAALAMECNHVSYQDMLDEKQENLARRLHADRKLNEHPQSSEVTRLWAVCKDGRRWTGDHFLTGPRAGTKDGPHEHRFTPLLPAERGIHPKLLRIAVGLEPMPW